jgi:hypothetical protein
MHPHLKDLEQEYVSIVQESETIELLVGLLIKYFSACATRRSYCPKIEDNVAVT